MKVPSIKQNYKFAALLSVLLLLTSCAGSPEVDESATQIPPEQVGKVQLIAGMEQPGVGAFVWPKAESPIKIDPEVEKAIDAVIASMTVEEKVGQTLQPEIRYLKIDELTKYHFGSVLNGGGSWPKGKGDNVIDWISLADKFHKASIAKPDKRAAIPVIWGTDAVHGHNNVRGATLFPHNVGLGAMRNPKLVKAVGEVTAREVAVTGIPWTFAPTVAVSRDERWGRAYESYSEDPDVVREYARAMVLGLQGNPAGGDLFAPDKVVSTAKHFIGDGGTYKGDDQGDTKVTEKELFEIHAQGYYSAIESGVQSIMVTFNSWNAYKLHGSKYMLTTVLKEQMGFDGLIVGDWNGHGQIPGCTNSSCAQAYNAGIDLIMVPEHWRGLYSNTIRQVNNGEIPMARIDDAVRRILRVKIRAGLFRPGTDNMHSLPSKKKFAGQSFIMGHAKHRAIAEQTVRESLVLLKNDGVLPISPDQKILVAGSHADDIANQSGGWTITWQGTDNTNADFPGATSVFGGFEEVAAEVGAEVELGKGTGYRSRPDVAVFVFGETPYAEYEGDLETVGLIFSGADKALRTIESYKKRGIKVVSVFMSGRPLAVNELIEASDAFVAAWLPGSEGQGIAEVLMANADGSVRHDFKGKLSFSWPRHKDQVPMNIGDADYDPQYPYGFGLKYADTAAE